MMIMGRSLQGQSMNVRREPLNTQETQVMHLREQGMTYASIGRAMGLSRERAKQVYRDAREHLKDYATSGADALSLLPGRARKFLELFSLTTRAAVREAVESGKLQWNEDRKRLIFDGSSPRNYGWGVWVVVSEWAGLPRPESPSRPCVTCPHCGGKVPL